MKDVREVVDKAKQNRFFNTASPILFIDEIHRFSKSQQDSLLGAVEPLLNPVWVMIFDGETPGPFALIGGFIVITAVTVWCVWDGRQKQPAA